MVKTQRRRVVSLRGSGTPFHIAQIFRSHGQRQSSCLYTVDGDGQRRCDAAERPSRYIRHRRTVVVRASRQTRMPRGWCSSLAWRRAVSITVAMRRGAAHLTHDGRPPRRQTYRRATRRRPAVPGPASTVPWTTHKSSRRRRLLRTPDVFRN